MNIKELRGSAGMTQQEFADYLNIPKRTIENWEGEKRTPPEYLVELIKYKIERELLTITRQEKNAIMKFKILRETWNLHCDAFKVCGKYRIC